MREWIDIKEAMPEPNTYVLVYTTNHWQPIVVAQYTINHRWEGVRAKDITHWMALPPAPI